MRLSTADAPRIGLSDAEAMNRGAAQLQHRQAQFDEAADQGFFGLSTVSVVHGAAIPVGAPVAR